MRYAWVLIAILAIIYPSAVQGVTGVSLGGKLGFARYTGDVLPSSGDVGDALVYGAVLEISTLPVLDFELHANYFSKDFTYSYDIAGVPVSGEFAFRDIHVLALAKRNLVSVPASPLGVYVGGGVGWHLLNTEVAKGVGADPALADQPFELFSNTAKVSGHGLVGLKVSPPVFPLAIYGEARFGRIFAEEPINTTQVEGGLLLRF